jgi:tetratricopeptide (TPR) repeat protein
MNSIKYKLNQALHCCRQNNFELATQIYNEILLTDPTCHEALANLGLIYLRKNNIVQAEEFIQKSIELRFDAVQLNNLVNIKRQLDKHNEALNLNEKLHLKHKAYITNKINILRALGRFDESFAITISELKKTPNEIGLLVNAGLVNNLKKKYKSACQFFIKGLRLYPDSITCLYNLGVTLNSLRKFKFARLFLERCAAIDTRNVDVLIALSQSYARTNILNQAKELLKQATTVRKEAKIFYNLAKLNFQDENYEDAKENYKKALSIDKNYYLANLGLSEIYLKQHEWSQGFDYNRWRIKEAAYYVDDLKENSIDKNKELNIFSEQGIGDEIFQLRLLQFINYKDFKKVNAYIDERLIKLSKLNFPYIHFESREKNKNSKLDNSKNNINMGSLFRIYIKSNEDIKNLRRITYPNSRKKINTDKKIIGLSWKSKNDVIGADKTLTLKKIFQYIDVEKYHFVNLQYGEKEKIEHEIDIIQKKYNVNFEKNSTIDLFNDIDSLFELVDICDKVLTISNVIAHIAGVIEKDSLVLLPKVTGRLWHWGNNDKNSIWYKKAVLLNQEKDGDWDSALKKIKKLM